MLVQALTRYAETYLPEAVKEPAFETKGVQYFVEIDRQGKFLTISERKSERKMGEKTIQIADPLNVPKSPVNRNTGIHPLLGCDAPQYVLGPHPDGWSSGKGLARHAEQHKVFIQLLRDAFEETGDDCLEACVRFYSRPEQVERAREELAKRKPASGALAALSLTGDDLTSQPVCKRPDVRGYWKEHYQQKFAERHAAAGQGLCLISNEFGPLALTHEKIKGASTIGGRPEVALMSFDKQAFQSYGWKKNVNSPVSLDYAEHYVLALSDLLRKGHHRRGENQLVRTRRDYGGVAFLYWTREPIDFNPFRAADEASEEDINSVLNLYTGGKSKLGTLDSLRSNDFHLLCVSGNGARLVVHDWFSDSLAQVVKNLRSWYENLRIADVFQAGSLSEPPGMRTLLSVMLDPAQGLDDKVNAGRSIHLARRALAGRPLDRSILFASLKRLRLASGSQRLSPKRAGLVRLCVNDLIQHDQKGVPMPQELDSGLNHRAYLCGRLMAVFESLQYQAHRAQKTQEGQEAEKGELNVTVADRYYGLASTFPQLAFPKLVTLSFAHLKKLRRANRGAAIALNRRLDELMDRLREQGATFPGQLSLKDQGRFAIGYHHQRAEDQRQAKAHKEQKEASQEEG